jgi:hypothetical protein
VFYPWQKELFENGAAAFQSQERPNRQVEEKQLAVLLHRLWVTGEVYEPLRHAMSVPIAAAA